MPELTDAERLNLNRQIAKWLGWTELRGNLYGKRPGGSSRFVEVVPDFTRDWNATALIIERLRESGWFVETIQPPAGDCFCRVSRKDVGSDFFLSGRNQAYASTLPEAVVRAALKVPNEKEVSE